MKKTKTQQAADNIILALKKNGGLVEPRRIIKNKYYRWAFWELVARGEVGLDKNLCIIITKPEIT